jgi:hypothetical protein
MFGKQQVTQMIGRSAENNADRRAFLRSAGLAGMGAVGAAALSGVGAAAAATTAGGPSDGAVLNFALNLEYLEAEFYLHAVYGHGLRDELTTGKGDRGRVVIGPQDTFDPYANENNFLLAAFIFEDVGVTAYKGAAPLIDNKTYLEAAAGILAVEAYHAGIVRTNLYAKDLRFEARKISHARDSLDGTSSLDQGIGWPKRANLVPTDQNGIAFSRSAAQVLNVVYLTPKRVKEGGFFPNGVNGSINTSGANG